jgi:hypothetical protein
MITTVLYRVVLVYKTSKTHEVRSPIASHLAKIFPASQKSNGEQKFCSTLQVSSNINMVGITKQPCNVETPDFFFRSAADTAQRLSPESWINAEAMKIGHILSRTCTIESSVAKSEHQHRPTIRPGLLTCLLWPACCLHFQ